MKKIVFLLLSSLFVLSSLFLGDVSKVSARSVEGGYTKWHYFVPAAGGRVNIDYQTLYMSPSAARQYASKVDVSFSEGFAWFGASFIPSVGPYIATVGFYRASEASQVASDLRSYADRNKPAQISFYRDNFYGTSGRMVGSWDGQEESIRPFTDPLYTSSVYRTYRN